VRPRRRYLRYLTQIAVHKGADSANRHDHGVINGSVLRYYELPALFLLR